MCDDFRWDVVLMRIWVRVRRMYQAIRRRIQIQAIDDDESRCPTRWLMDDGDDDP